MLLADDIGGTKTNLAIFSPGTGPHAHYSSLEVLVREFLDQGAMRPQIMMEEI